jgi:hypothetical protein
VKNIRNVDAFEDSPSLEKLKRKAKKHSVKVQAATETLVESLAEQNKKLSEANLLLRKMYKAAYRLLPKHYQEELDRLKSEVESIVDLEVHP